MSNQYILDQLSWPRCAVMNEDSSVVNRARSSVEKCAIRDDIIMGYLLNTVQYSVDTS